MTRKVLLIGGALSSAVYLAAIDIVAPLLHPDYHSFTSRMVSELFAVGAPTRGLLLCPMALYNLLVFAHAAGVAASARGQRARVLTAVALIGYGVCSTAGLLIAPMELRDAGISAQTLLHIRTTVAQGVFIASVLVFGAFVHGARFRVYSLSTLAICVMFGALASVEAARGSLRWIGLTERVNIYVWMVWLAALALSLLPAPVPTVTRFGDAPPRRRNGTGRWTVARHPVASYVGLTLAISWAGFLGAGGSGLLAGTDWRADPRFMNAVSVMLVGPPAAGLLLTVVTSGLGGLRGLSSRLLTWRIGGHWYAVALLTAPVIQLAVLLALAGISPVFLPAIITANDTSALLRSGIAIGLAGGFVEELGWTGFATPRLTPRYGVLGTGLIVGPVWGAWHLLQMWWVGRSSFGALPVAFYLAIFICVSVVTLTAFRVLMVWVYVRTESLLVAILMHASYIFTTLFVFAPPTTGVPFLIYSVLFAIALWAVVSVLASANGWRALRRSLRAGAS